MLPAEYFTSTVVGLIRAWTADGMPVYWDRMPILADALEDAGFSDARTLDKLRGDGLSKYDLEDFKTPVVPAQLADGDWDCVFAYAGETSHGDGSASVRAVPPGSEVNAAPFARWDVADVYGVSEGENDTQNWLVYGRLHDGGFVTEACSGAHLLRNAGGVLRNSTSVGDYSAIHSEMIAEP